MTKNREEGPFFWTPAEVADFLRVTPWTVTEWLRVGKLHGSQLANKRWIVPVAAVREFVEAGSNAPVTELPPPLVVPLPPAGAVIAAQLPPVAKNVNPLGNRKDKRHRSILG